MLLNLKSILVILCFFFIQSLFSQVIIWSEDFDGNSGAGSNWGALNQDIGAQGITPNQWYISCAENGNAAGACGTGCGTDQTLHLSSTTVGDLGAAYDASSVCLPGCAVCDFFPAFCSDVNTDRRSQSTNINTIGATGLNLNFIYMEGGQGGIDNCIIEYSINGGTSWLTLSDPAKTVVCGGQGTWTSAVIVLPVSCENIANLRIAYRWANNADGVGTDPSFAVDDITITRASLLPVSLTSFKSTNYSSYILLDWLTLSELNNAYFNIEKSYDGIVWTTIGNVRGNGNSSETQYYSFIDSSLSNSISYYRLKQFDFNGDYMYSGLITVIGENKIELLIYPNPTSGIFHINLPNTNSEIKKVNIYNQLGVLQNVTNTDIINGVVDVSNLQKGIYTLIIIDEKGNQYSRRLVKNNY